MNVQINEKLDYHYKGNVEEIVFFKMPKILFLGEDFKELSMSAKVLYMLLLDRVSISNQNNWVDKDNKVFIYYTQAEVMAKLNFSSKKVSNLFKELENVYSKNDGLIKRIKQGLRKPDLIYVKDLSSLEVNDISFDGEFKYSRPNIETKIDTKSDEVLNLENKIKLLEKEVARASKPSKQLGLNINIENSINAINDVENTEISNGLNDITCKNYMSRDVKTTSLEVSKVQPNKNNINNNNLINNNSFILSKKEEKQGMNERMIDKQIKSNIINEMYETKELPYSYTDSEIKMNVAIKELVGYDLTQANFRNKTVDEFYFSTYKLFTNALISMLTNKGNMSLNNQNVTYSKVYDKLAEYVSFEKDEQFNSYCHLNNLVELVISDYQKASTKTEIKYPHKYMQSCIWNVLQIGDVRMQSEIKLMMNDVDIVNKSIEKPQKELTTNKPSFNLQEVEDMWKNFVPRLV